MDTNKDNYTIDDLKQLMARLRDKDNGCPWDIEQDFETIKPHTVEEAYEVADAIERGDMNDLKDELGDLLFQVIFHAQMADEQSSFNFDDIVDHVTKKMIFRHPHVFEDVSATSADEVKNSVWETQKDKEKINKLSSMHYLDDVTRNLPSLALSNKIQKRVHKVGFEFPSIDHVFAKTDEELNELKQAIASGDQADIMDELGDFLFCAALLARTLKLDAEESLRAANLKFIDRFNRMEDCLKQSGTSLRDADLDEMQAAWQAIKGQNTEKPL